MVFCLSKFSRGQHFPGVTQIGPAQPPKRNSPAPPQTCLESQILGPTSPLRPPPFAPQTARTRHRSVLEGQPAPPRRRRGRLPPVPAADGRGPSRRGSTPTHLRASRASPNGL